MSRHPATFVPASSILGKRKETAAEKAATILPQKKRFVCLRSPPSASPRLILSSIDPRTGLRASGRGHTRSRLLSCSIAALIVPHLPSRSRTLVGTSSEKRPTSAIFCPPRVLVRFPPPPGSLCLTRISKTSTCASAWPTLLCPPVS